MRWLVIKDNTAIIHFPVMLEGLLPESFRPLAFFLNPGLHDDSDKFFKPGNLVLDLDGVKTFLSQSIQFGEQFSKPSDMAYLGAKKSEDFYSDTSLSLRWQISTYGQENNAGYIDMEYLKAQQLLLLEYTFEERMADLKSLSSSIGSSWKKLDSCLGIERDDEEFMAIDRVTDLSINTSANWKKLLWAFGLFLPADAFLLLSDITIAQELEEAGVVWEKSDHEDFWNKPLFECEVLKGTFRTGQKKTYLGRIRQDIKFLMVSNAGSILNQP
jgi:hypothetical protein